MEPTFNHLLRAFSNAEASLHFRDLFVPTGCWGEKKCKVVVGGGGEFGRVRGTEKGKKDMRESRFLLPIVPFALTVR